jgi:hypothetical protein
LWLATRVAGEAPGGAPPLEVWVDEAATAPNPDPLLVLAAQHATDVAANSHVVRNARPQEPAGGHGYTVQLSRSQSIGGRPVLEVSLFDEADERLFHESIPITGDRAAVLARLNGALLQIVNPAGSIARRELAAVGAVPGNDYQCVLKTETDRLEGGLRTDLVEDCLKRFPDSEYRAFWLSRMAFMGYRRQVMAGGVVAASGEPWQYLQRALAADADNPFANYMAAKVSMSRGNCAAARPYFERTLTNGNYSGVMISAVVSEAALCPGSLSAEQDPAAHVVSLFTAVPDPNPLLYTYLLFATAAVDRPDLSRRLLDTAISEDPQGSMADIHAALKEGLAGPAAFEANRDRLERVIDGFYWEPGMRRRMMDKLAAVAASPA